MALSVVEVYKSVNAFMLWSYMTKGFWLSRNALSTARRVMEDLKENKEYHRELSGDLYGFGATGLN